MKKYQMLEKAMKDYPKGTKFISLFGCEIESSGSFFIDGTGSVAENPSNCNVHESETGKWAEIVNHKIAVRVENEKEFNALMKYYKSINISLGTNKGRNWGSWTGKPLCIQFHDNGATMYEEFAITDIEFKDYQIIPFSDFAKDKGIKLPLMKSEDGVWLYEGDETHMVYPLEEYKNKVFDYALHPKHNCITEPHRAKAFSTKQSASDWIEAQKPKDIIINANSAYPIIVYAKPFLGNEYIHLDMSKRGDYNGANLCFSIQELREAVKAYDSLHEIS